MTREETLKIMSVLKAAYPNFYRGMSRDDALAAVNLWNTMFSDEPYSLVSNGVLALIACDTKGFPPSIGQVKEYIHHIHSQNEMTESEAWELVRKALSNSSYHAQEEFDKLPPILQRIIGSPTMLKDWSMVDIDDLQTVVQSNFMRSFRARLQSEKEYQALPSAIKIQIEQLASNWSISQIGDGTDD